jgi:dTDP-4-dehydrorhamnose reductase
MKILLTGANGLVGQKIKGKLVNIPGLEVIATSLHDEINKLQASYCFEKLDITHSGALDLLFRKYQPHVLINSAAEANVNKCEKEKKLCREVNTNAVAKLVQLCNQYNTHLVQLSTDFIFDGTKTIYDENDTASPLSFYGESKAEAENIIVNQSNKWTIIRTILVYGFFNGMKRNNIVTWVIEALKQEKYIKVVNDQFRCPTLAEDLASAVAVAATESKEGIFHVSGSEMYSIAEIAYITAEFFALNKKQITEVSTAELNEPAARPLRTRFDLSKSAKILHFKPHTFKEGLNTIEKQLNKKI